MTETWESDREPELWEPYYEAPFTVAVKRFFQKYATFHGRAGRAEYWWWQLASVILVLVLEIPIFATLIPAAAADERPGPAFFVSLVVVGLVSLALVVPTIALTVRRLHDINMSGWMFLIALIPYIGGLILFIFCLLPPKPEGARFDQVQP